MEDCCVEYFSILKGQGEMLYKLKCQVTCTFVHNIASAQAKDRVLIGLTMYEVALASEDGYLFFLY